MIAPLRIGRRTAAADLGGVDHIVVHQRGGVDELHSRPEMDGAGVFDIDPAIANQLGGEQQERGPQPLAAARVQVAADGGDGIHRGE